MYWAMVVPMTQFGDGYGAAVMARLRLERTKHSIERYFEILISEGFVELTECLTTIEFVQLSVLIFN